MNKHKKPDSLHQCPECGLRYRQKEWMEKCEAWCKEHKSCNLEITSYSIENEKYEQQ